MIAGWPIDRPRPEEPVLAEGQPAYWDTASGTFVTDPGINQIGECLISIALPEPSVPDESNKCWHCCNARGPDPARPDPRIDDLPLEPVTEREMVQIWRAISSGRPVRSGLVARLYRHAQAREVR
jgi:hypothetical protein